MTPVLFYQPLEDFANVAADQLKLQPCNHMESSIKKGSYYFIDSLSVAQSSSLSLSTLSTMSAASASLNTLSTFREEGGIRLAASSNGMSSSPLLNFTPTDVVLD